MDEFLDTVTNFCKQGGFLQLRVLRDPEILQMYAETANRLRRKKTLSHDEKMLLTRIEIIFCGAYGDIDRQIINLSSSLQLKNNDLEGYLRCYQNKESDFKKYHSKTFLQSCSEGKSQLSDLNDWIDYWHVHDTGKSLMNFLGLDPTEYRQWAEGNDHIFAEVLQSQN